MLLYIDLLPYWQKRYFGCLRLLRSWMQRRILERRLHAGRVVYANIRGLHKNLSDLSLIARGGDVFFLSRDSCLLQAPLLQLLRGEVNRFQGLAAYVREGFLVHRQRGYELRCFEARIFRIYSSSHNFMYSAGTGIHIYLISFLLFVDGHG